MAVKPVLCMCVLPYMHTRKELEKCKFTHKTKVSLKKTRTTTNTTTACGFSLVDRCNVIKHIVIP